MMKRNLRFVIAGILWLGLGPDARPARAVSLVGDAAPPPDAASLDDAGAPRGGGSGGGADAGATDGIGPAQEDGGCALAPAAWPSGAPGATVAAAVLALTLAKARRRR